MKIIKHSLAIVFAMLVSMPAWASDEGPKEVIETTVTSIINALEAREDTTKLTEKDRDTIRKIVDGRFDYEAMASRSLGRPWKKLDNTCHNN